ncbi:MAG: HEPN domain-containing protein, partial [Candidatus Aenigmatarchaeota archaeon]
MFLKAFLAFHNKPIPRIHEIETLIAICSEIDESFKELYKFNVSLLTRYYKSRYPPSVLDVNEQEAKEAIEIAEKVKE